VRRLEILWVLMETPVTNAPFRFLVGQLGRRHHASLCTFYPLAGVGPAQSMDAVYDGNGTIRGFLVAFSRALRGRQPDVVSIHLPHLAILSLPLLMFLRGWRWRRSTVYVVHNSFPTLRPRNKVLTVLALGLYRHIVVCGGAALASLPHLVRRLAGRDLVVIPNGADVAGIRTAQAAPTGRPGFSLVNATRMEPTKSLDTAIRAFALADLGSATLNLIGDGSQRQSLQALAESATPGKVRFPGMLPREEVYAAMKIADGFLSTSTSEGMPVAVLEAMAVGLPLVLSDIPPHREIADGLTGAQFVALGDVDGFARAIRDLASRSKEERSKMGAELQNHVETNFSLDAYLAAYESLYLSLAS
jgi:glycosyltransferase involved in cell wall biosynthesis